MTTNLAFWAKLQALVHPSFSLHAHEHIYLILLQMVNRLSNKDITKLMCNLSAFPISHFWWTLCSIRPCLSRILRSRRDSQRWAGRTPSRRRSLRSTRLLGPRSPPPPSSPRRRRSPRRLPTRCRCLRRSSNSSNSNSVLTRRCSSRVTQPSKEFTGVYQLNTYLGTICHLLPFLPKKMPLKGCFPRIGLTNVADFNKRWHKEAGRTSRSNPAQPFSLSQRFQIKNQTFHSSNRSPFRRPSGGDKTSDNGGRPPLPLGGRAASLERPVSAMAFGGGRSIVLDPENNHVQIVREDARILWIKYFRFRNLTISTPFYCATLNSG